MSEERESDLSGPLQHADHFEASVESADHVEEAVQGTAQVGEAVESADQVEEAVQGVPVLAEVRTIERSPANLPAVQAAAAAATGFVAGAATIALVKRRRLVRAQRNAPRRPVDMLPIVGSRTFLVDVHLIAKPD